MTFDEATEGLRAFVLIDDIAKALDCSTGEVRKMRSFHDDGGSISAPMGWDAAPAALARQQAAHLNNLADILKPQP